MPETACDTARPASCPHKMFHTLFTSPSAGDADRPDTFEVPPSAAFAPGCRADQQLFSAAHNTKFSLGEEVFEKSMNCPDSYPVSSWMSSSLAFSALLQCKADFSELRYAYLSLLPRRFQLLHRRDPAFTALVLETSPWAVLVLYVKPMRAGEDAFMTFQRLG